MPPVEPPDFSLIARTLVDTAERRVSYVEDALNRHIVKDEAAHGVMMDKIQQIQMQLARAEGASLTRLLPWIALALSAVGLGANLLKP